MEELIDLAESPVEKPVIDFSAFSYKDDADDHDIPLILKNTDKEKKGSKEIPLNLGKRKFPTSENRKNKQLCKNNNKSDISETAKGLYELYNSPGSIERPLNLLIVGHNPSAQSWNKGHFYANPSNRMWYLLRKAGIVPNHFKAENDIECPDQCGLGFTDLLCGISGTDSSKFSDEQLRSNSQGFYSRIHNHIKRCAKNTNQPEISCYPKIIAFSGVRQWKVLFPAKAFNHLKTQENCKKELSSSPMDDLKISKNKNNSVLTYGVQSLRPFDWPKYLENSIVFLLPSSSGAAAMSNEMRENPYLELGKLLLNNSWSREDEVNKSSFFESEIDLTNDEI